ncbi:diaminopimelate decarboxylase [Bacillus kwashiorkori]|uniref:diaminopimelate decarboxylase n=1 Tax=Bacillus kwashiorkori TaxID=1522318 RepID=UPI00078475E4|nr:diaminopimelate decarboxylase [Bacillus kwashiorkori]
MFFNGTKTINDKGHLEIGGCDTVALAKQYGTPLIVYDVQLIRERARKFKQTYKKFNMQGEVAYASKAFSSIAIYQLMQEEGLSLDVVSGGELYTAIHAGFPSERIHFHGNNKSIEEIEMALAYNIGIFVVDNFHELYLLEQICEEQGKMINILLRVTPGIEAHTHEYILTGQEDSKFGFDLQTGQAEQALEKALAFEKFNVLGVHCHIGSQIFETTGFTLAIEKIYEHIKLWKANYHYEPKIVNVGGGFGIRYTEADKPLEPEHYLSEIFHTVKKESEKYQLTVPEVWIEPGRSLVGDAGTTLYKAGSRKIVPNIREYVAVDGSMSDNIRPALYDAKYDAILANKALHEKEELVSIAGKACESGDMLIWDIALPRVESDDILAVFSTGAYGYSMASNYNRLRRPAVIFVENGNVQIVVKRETYDDLIKLDVPLRTI